MAQQRYDPTNTFGSRVINTQWLAVGKYNGVNEGISLTFPPIKGPYPVSEVRLWVSWDNSQAGAGYSGTTTHEAQMYNQPKTKFTYTVSGSIGTSSVVLPAEAYSTAASWNLAVQGADASANNTYKAYWKTVYIIVSSDTAPSAPAFTGPASGGRILNTTPRIPITTGASNSSQRLYVQGPTGWVNSVDQPQYFSVSGWLAAGTTTFFVPQTAISGSFTFSARAENSSGQSSPTVTRGVTVESPNWTDTLVQNQTYIKAKHITELRDRINTTRAYYGLAVQGWSDNIIAGSTSLAKWTAHINELRNAVSSTITSINALDGSATKFDVPSPAWIAITQNKPRVDMTNQLRQVIATL